MMMKMLPTSVMALTLLGCAACDANPRGATVAQAALPLSELLPAATEMDSRKALQQALLQANGQCLDGEGATFDVDGTIEVPVDLCLLNVKLVQVAKTPDLAAYVSGRCPVNDNPDAEWRCGDPAPAPDDARAIRKALSVRTLLIRPAGDNGPLSVRLENVAIDRGDDPSAGSRADSAGIWIQNVRRLRIRNLDISGHGKGYGLFLTKAEDVEIDGLAIHDMHWSPYRGEPGYDLTRIETVGWNRIPIHELRGAGKTSRFLGVRIQEQLTGAHISHVSNVRLSDIRIENIEARLSGGTLPWQTDGLTLGGKSEDIAIDGITVARSWEAIDIKGNHGGVDDVSIRNARLTDSFSFGLKAGGDVEGLSLADATIRGAGKSGVLLYGDTHRARLSNVDISGVGKVRGPAGPILAYHPDTVAGVEVRANAEGTPEAIGFSRVTVEGDHAYGLLSRGARGISSRGLISKGQRRKAVDIGAAD